MRWLRGWLRGTHGVEGGDFHMAETVRPNPDAILAHVRLLRATDRLLDVAEELRDARDRLQILLDRPVALAPEAKREAARVE